MPTAYTRPAQECPPVAGGSLNPEFFLRGIPPPMVGVASSVRSGRQLLGATEWKPPLLLDGGSGKQEDWLCGASLLAPPPPIHVIFHLADMASSPGGVLVGSVTSQISTIRLTRTRGCPSSTSSSPLSPTALQTEESESGEAELSG